MISTQRVTVLILGFFYYLFLVFLYDMYISPIYSYMGFLSDFSWGKVLLSCALVIFFNLISRCDGVVGFYHHIILILLYTPSLSIYSAGVTSDLYIYATTLAILIVFTISSKIETSSLMLFYFREKQLLIFLFVISSITIISYIYFIGFGRFNFNLMKVYEYRQESSDALPSIFGYVSPAVGKIFIPTMMILAIIYRKYFFLISGFLFSIFIFGFTAHKSPLFYPFIVFFIYYLTGKEKWVFYLYTGVIFILVGSFIDFHLSILYPDSGFGIFGSILSRRAIYLPALLNDYYLDYFSTHPLFYWSESKLSLGLVNNVYDMKMVNIIGAEYFGQSDMSANTGFIGSGYANGGWGGLIIYSFFVGLLLSLLSSFAKKIGDRFVIGTSFVIIFSILISTDFLTSLLTHGLIFLLLLYTMIPLNPQLRTL